MSHLYDVRNCPPMVAERGNDTMTEDDTKVEELHHVDVHEGGEGEVDNEMAVQHNDDDIRDDDGSHRRQAEGDTHRNDDIADDVVVVVAFDTR